MNFRHPPIHEITISRGEVWLRRADAVLGAVVLFVGGAALAIVSLAAYLR